MRSVGKVKDEIINVSEKKKEKRKPDEPEGGVIRVDDGTQGTAGVPAAGTVRSCFPLRNAARYRLAGSACKMCVVERNIHVPGFRTVTFFLYGRFCSLKEQKHCQLLALLRSGPVRGTERPKTPFCLADENSPCCIRTTMTIRVVDDVTSVRAWRLVQWFDLS